MTSTEDEFCRLRRAIREWPHGAYDSTEIVRALKDDTNTGDRGLRSLGYRKDANGVWRGRLMHPIMHDAGRWYMLLGKIRIPVSTLGAVRIALLANWEDLRGES